MDSKLEICRRTRQIAADSLKTALEQVLSSKKPVSEASFRDLWLNELRKHKEIFPDGWYTPPPYGIESNFGTERVRAKSFRPENMWPKDNIFLDKKEGIASFYASPVDRKSGIIGDFGLTLYFGNDKKIKKHLSTCIKIDKKVFEFAQLGMTFCEVTKHTHKLLEENGLITNLFSLSDPTGTNIGHTIPFSFEDMSNEEKKLLQFADNDWTKFKDMISKKRRFLNSNEKLKIIKGIAFTIEPRPYSIENSKIPTIWFHNIIVFRQDGEKNLLTGFDEIFKLVGMDYMLD